jgi:zinc protease
LDPKTLDLGFTVMRDFADGALLKPEEIDKERGVILAEKTSRDSVGYRMMQKQFQTLLPDSKVSHRFPIGLEEVIKNAPRERFVDLYSRYYIPARMTFVVVGDIDPAAMEKRIKETFSSMKNPENAGPDPDLGPIPEFTGVKPSIFSDPELTSTDLSLVQVRRYKPEPDDTATRAKDMPLAVANAMLNRRFARIAKKDGSPIVSGAASHDVMFNYAELGSIDVTAANDDWEKALPVMDHEFRKALEFGFTESEFAEAKANLLNSLEQAVKSEPTMKSQSLLRAYAQALINNKVLSAPEADLEVARGILEKLDAEACHKAFRKFWAGVGMHLILSTKQAP